MSMLSVLFHQVEPELLSLLESEFLPLVEKYLEQVTSGPEHDLIAALFALLQKHADSKGK